MDELIAEGRVVQAKPGGVPREKRYLDEMPGVSLQNDWNDILPASGKESLGYSTQKPLVLLERIIQASSKPWRCRARSVLWMRHNGSRGAEARPTLGRDRRDPYRDPDHSRSPKKVLSMGAADCSGSGQKTSRGLVNSLVATSTSFNGGPPLSSVAKLAEATRKELTRVSTANSTSREGTTNMVRAIISVKGGDNLSPSMVRDLAGTREQEGADMGIFICLKEPSLQMRSAAAA